MKRFYRLIVILYAMGLFLVGLNLLGKGFEICVFHRFFHIPCATCGTIRGLLAILRADIYAAVILYNPLSLLIFLSICAVSILLIYDYIFSKTLLYSSFLYLKRQIRRPIVYLPLAFLLIINWLWNISKAL